jgi:hypothetical protein
MRGGQGNLYHFAVPHSTTVAPCVHKINIFRMHANLFRKEEGNISLAIAGFSLCDSPASLSPNY